MKTFSSFLDVHFLIALDLYISWNTNRELAIAVKMRNLQSLSDQLFLRYVSGQTGHFGSPSLWIWGYISVPKDGCFFWQFTSCFSTTVRSFNSILFFRVPLLFSPTKMLGNLHLQFLHSSGSISLRHNCHLYLYFRFLSLSQMLFYYLFNLIDKLKSGRFVCDVLACCTLSRVLPFITIVIKFYNGTNESISST